jgi:hypothetical protein
MSGLMKRLFLFLGGLPLGARLQILAVTLILGYQAWFDFQRGVWPVTIVIVALAWLIGWWLMPVMVAHPHVSQRVWGTFGIAFLVIYVLAHKQWWWRTMAAHFGRELAMWLDLSCGYWFISELRLQQERAAQGEMVEEPGAEPTYYEDRIDRKKDDWGDKPDRSARGRN